MELEHRENHAEAKVPKLEPAAPRAEPATFTGPLASEGLEQVRDSHC